jgi:hypothetical protein
MKNHVAPFNGFFDTPRISHVSCDDLEAGLRLVREALQMPPSSKAVVVNERANCVATLLTKTLYFINSPVIYFDVTSSKTSANPFVIFFLEYCFTTDQSLE